MWQGLELWLSESDRRPEILSGQSYFPNNSKLSCAFVIVSYKCTAEFSKGYIACTIYKKGYHKKIKDKKQNGEGEITAKYITA